MTKKKNKRPGSSQQPTGGNFWTFDSKQNFHWAVTNLFRRHQMPDGDCQGYRHEQPPSDPSHDYVLTAKEELQLADDVAFLFPCKECPGTITAAAVEEHDDGSRLVVRLGVNEEPEPHAVEQLRDMMAIVQTYAVRAQDRDTMREKLLDTVVESRTRRLLQRLQTRNGGLPNREKKECGPLHVRLQQNLQSMKCNFGHLSIAQRTELNAISLKLEQLLPLYKALDTCSEARKTSHLKAAIKASHDIWRDKDGSDSLQQQLAHLGFHPCYSQTKEVLQVDKIARYYAVCSSILRTARRHQQLFSNIEVRVCKSPKRNESSMPSGATAPCRTHGEVQLVMYYEQFPHDPPPRAIGSSRSMCFLCNMLIQKHGCYWISHSHKRLYNLWTIPDINWMNPHQAARFHRMIKEMTVELVSLRERPPPSIVAWAVESRLHLPFSGPPSTASNISIASNDSDATIRPAPSRGSLTPIPKFQNFTIDIPYPAQEEPPGDTVVELEAEATSGNSTSPAAQSQSSDVSIPQSSSPPTELELENDATSKYSTPPASPIITSRLPASPSPSLLMLLSRKPSSEPSHKPSHLTLLPSTIPFTHNFFFQGPDVEITISKTLFIFEFASVATGTLNIQWHDMADSREPFSPDVTAGLHGPLKTRPFYHIDRATLGEETVCMKRDGGISGCEFTVRIDDMTVVKIGIVWDEQNR